ncbi:MULTISPECIES: ComF family protein [Thiomicrorhabdus]|uniref:ComF family protein n=1 Tax=Thiomicrorhabdus heinhorstiae TaxID=2748010 RepID=A0ABS0BVQ4_9GAMM|nr:MULTISPECIES: ComF family protein [Thiomicrorhabdus]MBF6057444.1 ComF family protein [Thiomicrorhabdus heinhorstiae]
MDWKSLRRRMENWWLPPRCVLSGAPGEEFDLSLEQLQQLRCTQNMCPQCAGFSHESRLCGSCLAEGNAVDRSQVAWFFSGPLIELIHGLKYGNRYAYGRLLAELWAPKLQADGVELLLPVPIHPLRRRDRGYNQAEVLARNLGSMLNIPVCSDALFRIRNTPSQTSLSAKQRQENLKTAFDVNAERLQGVRHIALVDDVITTGATMRNLALALRKSERIETIQAWATAKTE